MESLGQAVENIRRPEVRTKYSDVLVQAVQGYLQEVYNQPHPPKEIKTLKDSKVLYFPFGSVLRGTADPSQESDIDMIALASDYDLFKLLAASMDGSMHPSKINIEGYISKKFKTDPNYKDYADVKPPRVNPWNGGVDFLIEQYVKRGDNGEMTYELFLDKIASLLTAPYSLVFESAPGALIFHQRQIIQAFTDLQIRNPQRFKENWESLERAFAKSIIATESKHPELDAQLLSSHVKASGRFPGQEEHATQLLKGVRKTQKLPSLEKFQAVLGVLPNPRAA